MTQALGGGLRARANADYVSDIAPEQLYQQNIYRATRSTRSFGGNVSGSWSQFVLSGTLDRTDVFYPDGSYTTYGGLPRINFNRQRAAHRQVAVLLRRRRRVRHDAPQHDQPRRRTDPRYDQGLTRHRRRADGAHPVHALAVSDGELDLRLAWHLLDREPRQRQAGAANRLARQFFDFSSSDHRAGLQPHLQRRGDRTRLKMKHVIEPVFTIRRRPPSTSSTRSSSLESTDYTVGNVWEFSYGLNNRLYAKRTASREVLSVAVNQSYYTDAPRRSTLSSIRAAAMRDRHEQVHRALAVVARGAHRAAAGRLPHGVGPHVPHAEDARRQWLRQQRRIFRRPRAGAGGATFRDCRDSTTKTLPTTI